MPATWPVIVGIAPPLANRDEVYDGISARITFLGTTWSAVSGDGDPGAPVAGSLRNLAQYRAAIEGLAPSFASGTTLIAYTFTQAITDAIGLGDWSTPDPPRTPFADDWNDMKAVLEVLVWTIRSPDGWTQVAAPTEYFSYNNSGLDETDPRTSYEEAWDNAHDTLSDADGTRLTFYDTNVDIGFTNQTGNFGHAHTHTNANDIHAVHAWGVQPSAPAPEETKIRLYGSRTIDGTNGANFAMVLDGVDTQPTVVKGTHPAMTNITTTASAGAGAYSYVIDMGTYYKFTRVSHSERWAATNPLGEADGNERASVTAVLGERWSFSPF